MKTRTTFKRISNTFLLLFAIAGMTAVSSCEGPEGPQGEPGTNVEAAVFELNNVNFNSDASGYFISGTYPTTFSVLDSDVVLVYRLSGLIDSQTPIWQQIPRTIYLNDGNEVDYDFDFSAVDFQIYVDGTFDLTSDFTDGQTFRIVVVPGYFADKMNKKIDYSDYNAVIKALNIDDSKVQQVKL